MQPIFNYFWQLCLFKRHPSELPNQHSVLLVVTGIYLSVITVAGLLSYPNRGLLTTFAMIMVGLTIQVVFIFMLMWFKGVAARLPSVIGNLLGVSALLTCILLPINLTLLSAEPGIMRTLADSLTWVWLGWWLTVCGYVLSKSAQISIVQGALIAFMIELLGVLSSYSLFPGA